MLSLCILIFFIGPVTKKRGYYFHIKELLGVKIPVSGARR
jgi:hypothetical protein